KAQKMKNIVYNYFLKTITTLVQFNHVTLNVILNNYLINEFNLNLIDRNHICFNHNLNANYISIMKLHFDIVTQLLQSMRQEIELKDNRINKCSTKQTLK
ncbi:hypothetical protein RFI_34949, partial [Reticulomyxa filosa]